MELRVRKIRKRSKMTAAFLLVLIGTALACAVYAGAASDTDAAAGYGMASPSVTGALHVQGTQLTGSDGKPVQLRGISTHGLAWFPQYVNEECFRQLHEEWKVNVIRLAMYTAESGGYCTDGDPEALKSLIEEGVACAARQDMYVIIDWHILSDYDPNMHLEEAKAFFAEMSQKYADEIHVLYEICNEPNGGTPWQDIRAYAKEIIPVIRANDKDAVILVGTPNWSQGVDEAAADPIEGYENIMYTLHFYAATHKEDLRGRMEAAQADGLPIFVSEYGICDASGSGAIDTGQADAWVETMDRLGISYVAWNLSNKDETSAILKNSCMRISGFTAEDLSESGAWLYGMLTGEKITKEDGVHGEESEKAGSPRAEDSEKTETASPSQAEDSEGTQTASPSRAEDSEKSGGENPAENGKDADFRSGSMEVSAQVVNSWQAEGKTCSQYQLTVQNVSGEEIHSWEIALTFAEAFALLDGWNGDYTVEGNTLHITSKDYNGNLPADGEAADIGFIISGGGEILSE